MQYKHFEYNAFELWELCTNASDSQAQEVFWADIVLHIKANPGRAVFFENLFKELKIIDEQSAIIKDPLDVVSKKLICYAVYFDKDFWSKIIKNWAKINIELKLRTQTALLQNPTLIKEFLTSFLDKQKNPKTVINNIARASGLVKKYAKNDVVLMFCHIIAESFENYQINNKEIKSVMNDGMFQMADDMLEVEDLDTKEQDTQPVIVDLQNTLPQAKQLKELCEDFISSLKNLDIAQNDWEIVDDYLIEAGKIVSTKNLQRQEMLKRKQVVEDFTNKLCYIKDAYCMLVDNLAIKLPQADIVADLDNNALELATGFLISLQDVMSKYKTLNQEKSETLSQEKKRLGLLYTVMTDIESNVQSLALALDNKTTNQAPSEPENLQEQPEQALQQPIEEQPESIEQIEPQDCQALEDKEIEIEDLEQQIDLFTSKGQD